MHLPKNRSAGHSPRGQSLSVNMQSCLWPPAPAATRDRSASSVETDGVSPAASRDLAAGSRQTDSVFLYLGVHCLFGNLDDSHQIWEVSLLGLCCPGGRHLEHPAVAEALPLRARCLPSAFPHRFLSLLKPRSYIWTVSTDAFLP